MKKNQAEEIQNETDFPLYLYHHGKNDRIYEFLGAHKAAENGAEGYMFRVWAPHAQSVSVVGDFNGWDDGKHVMHRMIDNEVFELFIPGLKQYDVYKYCITAADGRPGRAQAPELRSSFPHSLGRRRAGKSQGIHPRLPEHPRQTQRPR